jgi:hypothetical protein
MAPGKAPAAPTSRPVVIGHKAAAQQSQTTVSGIGEAEPRGLLDARHKVAVRPADHPMPFEVPIIPSTPENPAPLAPKPHEHTDPRPVPTDDPKTPADESILPADAAEFFMDTPSAAAQPAPDSGTAAQPPARTGGTPPDSHSNDALAALAMEQETPRPASPEPTPATEHPPTTFEPLAPDDAMHNAAPPSLDHQVVVSHHSMASGGTARLIGLTLLAILFAVLILDILLDAGVVSSSGIPHTNLF